MITAHDRNDAAHSRRIRHFLPLFESASPPDPEDGNWRAWETLMAVANSPRTAAFTTP